MATFDGSTQIKAKLLYRLALCVTAGDGGNLSPEAALFGLVDDYVDRH
jgi:hypothetical protein